MTERVLLVVTVAALVANTAVVVAKLARARFVLDNVEEVGLDPRRVPVLAAVQGAGVAGVASGLLGWSQVGLAAATGLALFFAVATAAHLRARVLHSIGYPLGFLVLAVAAAAHFAGR